MEAPGRSPGTRAGRGFATRPRGCAGTVNVWKSLRAEVVRRVAPRLFPARPAVAVRPLHLDAVAVGVADEEAVDAADLVPILPGDALAPRLEGRRRLLHVRDPETEMVLAVRLRRAHHEMEVDLADAIPGAGEIEAFGPRRLFEFQHLTIEALRAGEIRDVEVQANDRDRHHLPQRRKVWTALSVPSA